MRPPAFEALSPAKINLILGITGKRKDGYHNIATLFQMVDLYDGVTFRPAPSGEVSVTCSDGSIRQEENLAYKGAMALWKRGCTGVHIHIEKKIPSGAGLGGGSSNAATTLNVLNKLWKLGHSTSFLSAKAARLGADVPFFLNGPRAWATGIGEKLTPLPACRKFHVLLVKPPLSIPTQTVYREYDRRLTKYHKLVRIRPQLKSRVSVAETERLLRNDLEGVVVDLFPLVGGVINRLKETGSSGVMLSGSGSAVFALFREYESALRAYDEVGDEPWWRALVTPLGSTRHLLKKSKKEEQWR